MSRQRFDHGIIPWSTLFRKKPKLQKVPHCLTGLDFSPQKKSSKMWNFHRPAVSHPKTQHLLFHIQKRRGWKIQRCFVDFLLFSEPKSLAQGSWRFGRTLVKQVSQKTSVGWSFLMVFLNGGDIYGWPFFYGMTFRWDSSPLDNHQLGEWFLFGRFFLWRKKNSARKPLGRWFPSTWTL